MNRQGRVAAMAAFAVLACLAVAACGPDNGRPAAEATTTAGGEDTLGTGEPADTDVSTSLTGNELPAGTVAPDPGAAMATPTTMLTAVKTSDPTLHEPTAFHIGPTVTIELPYNGWQPAPTGSVKIPFSGWATDAAGTAIPGTRLRWTAIEGGTLTVLCAGSDFGPPPAPGGIAVVTDCTQFHRTFTNPRGGSGPSITIRLEAKDQVGLVGSAEVVIALYTPTT